MENQNTINFLRIAEAIEYLQKNFKSQPGLFEVAGKAHLSPYHFQRLFTEWAGTSPKKFLQYLSIEHAKKMLKVSQSSLFETAFTTGLSGTGRLHDLFVTIEGMTPLLEILLLLLQPKVFVIWLLGRMKHRQLLH